MDESTSERTEVEATLLTLPYSALVDSIFVYLSEEDLFALRRVSRVARVLATEEIRRRRSSVDVSGRPTIYVRCCTSLEQLNALLAVYGESPNHVEYRSIPHARCDFGRLHRFPDISVSRPAYFADTRALTISARNFRMYPPKPRLFGFGEAFPNITRLEFYGVVVSTRDICAALRNRWTRLTFISVERCVTELAHWLLALNKNVTSITARRNFSTTYFRTTVGEVGDVDDDPYSAASLNERLPEITFLSLDTTFAGIATSLDAFEMVNSARNLREAHLRICRATRAPNLLAPRLERLRLQLLLDACESFRFRRVSCEALRSLEVKFFSTPSRATAIGVLRVFAHVRSFTLTATYVDGEFSGALFAAVSSCLARLEEFEFRRRGDDWSAVQTRALLNYLRRDCGARLVRVWLRQTRNSSEIYDFVYDVVGVALSNAGRSYAVRSALSVGCVTLPENVSFSAAA